MNIPERPSPQTAYLPRPFPVPTVPDPRFETHRMPGAYVDSDEENDAGHLSGAGTSNGVPSSSRTPGMSLGRAYAIAEAERQAAIARDRQSPASVASRQAALIRERNGYPSQPYPSSYAASLPGNNIAPWHAELESQGFASYTPYGHPSQRPGFVNGGIANPLLLLGDRLASGRSVYGSQNPGPGAGLGSVINRTNGYDYNNLTDASGNPLNDRLTSYIHDVMDDPRKTAEEIQNLLSNIRPDMEIPAEERGETPEALKYSLYTHQQVALKWMSGMEEGTNKGGILADDMGLGKTISTLALMVTRKSTTPTKTNLIVGPVALIKQWEAEIRKKLKPEHRLSVILFHQKKLQYSDMKNYDVVLTTYGKLASEYRKYTKHLEARQDSVRYEAHDDLELQRMCPLIHPRSKFYRVILDEAQCIKNRLGQASLGCNQLSAQYRWCLTGTPMMNGVAELYPLIRFLKIRPYNELKRFTEHFKGLTAKKYTSEVQKERSMQQLRILLKAIMLRRMKDSKIDGKPILELPPKTEIIQNCVFSEDEQKFYKELETKSQVTFNKYLRAGTVGKNYSHVLVLLLRLRQACCHPHLNMDVEYAAVNNDVSPENMEDFAKQLDNAVVARLKAAEGFDCPICFDAVADPTIFFPCGHDTCAECFTSLTENAIQANIRSGQEGEAAPKCPECRAPVQPKQVFTYTVFKKVHMPESISDVPDQDKNADEEEDDATESGSDDETASETSDDDADENGDLRDFIVADDADTESEAEPSDGDDDEFPEVLRGVAGKSSKKAKKGGKARRSRRNKKDKKGKGKADEVKPHMLKTLRLEASKNREARRKYMRYLKKNWEPSAKTTKVCEILKEIEPSGEKTIIFSQWTALLDLLEIPIKYELGIKYCRYDGGMSRTQRDEAITQFVENPRVKVLLVSLRAGNAGLNLTVASHVIIFDPFWNPFIEMQAVDRAHRIGQQLPVQVHRVLVKGSGAEGGKGAEEGAANALDETVEDRIVKLQDQKRGLINAALDEGESRSLGRLSERELRYLFGV
jgi:SNF2 family DNA or RNA helicase